MTENKRFWLITRNDEVYLEEMMQTGYVRDNELIGEKSITFEEAVNTMNALHEENEQLKQQLQTRHIVQKQYEENQQLSEEIEQLKQLINDKTCDNVKMKRVLNATKKENEQLKKELVEVHEICAYYENRIKELKGDVE